MKNKRTLVLMLTAILLAFPMSYTWGQEKEEKEAQKKEQYEQQQRQKELDERKKKLEIMMKEQQVIQKELMEEMKQEQYQRAVELYREGGARGDYIVTAPPPAPPVWTSFGSENSLSLSLMKSFEGESTKKTTSFTIDDDQSRIRFSVKGKCKAGEIVITFILPSGKAFTSVTIDSSADIEWSQSLTMEEKSIYKGEWKIDVKANKAKGYYKASIKSY